jgi:hypothetical protein
MKLNQAVLDQWLEAAWRDGFSKGVDGTDEIPDFKKLDPRGDSVDKSKTDYEDSSKLDFNPCKCSARTYKCGWGVQCTRSGYEGGTLCKTHLNQLNAVEDGVGLKFGLYNEERPSHWYNKPDGTKISWTDTRKSSSTKASPKGSPKVKEMKEYLSTRIPNESLKGLKKPELLDLYNKEKQNEESQGGSDTESMSENEPQSPPPSPAQSQPTPPSPDVDSQEPEPEPEPQLETESEPEPEPQPEPEPEPDSVVTATQVEASNPPASPPPSTDQTEKMREVLSGMKVSALKKRAKEEGVDGKKLDEADDADNVKGTLINLIIQKSGEVWEDNDSENDELQEDDQNIVPITFEGVDYLEEEGSGKIFTPDYNFIGKWDEECNIVWIDDSARVDHETKRD